MSAKAVGVLAENQPLSSCPRTKITRSFADFLVSMLVVERISQRLVRMLPRNSEIRRGRFEPTRYVPDTFPANDQTGTKFQFPQSPLWQEQHLQAIQSLEVRAGLSLSIFRRELRRAN